MSETINLLLTSGSGPEECRLAVGYLFHEMEREALRAGLLVHETDGCRSGNPAPKSLIVTLTGEGAGRFANGYMGSIKLVFKSPVRPTHARKNWFVGVEKLDERVIRPEEPVLNISDLRFETMRSSGAGGQHVNTTDSAVRAIHLPTGLTTVARDERSQHRNKALAIQRIGTMLLTLSDKGRETDKKGVFLTHKALERGNPVRTLKL